MGFQVSWASQRRREMTMVATSTTATFRPGDLVRARDRDWVVLPETRGNLLRLQPLGGSENDATLIYLPLESKAPVHSTFDPPDPSQPGSQESAQLLCDALRLKLRAGAGPFRSFGKLNFEPYAFQLVPLLMALKLETIRLLVADDVGIGKTIEAGLIAKEMLDRGEIERLAVICPPHLCDQWQRELAQKFSINAEVVRSGSAARLERGLRPDESVFEVHPFTIVSLDYIKSERRRIDFQRACPEFVIVDEAHTCVQSNSNSRHQRYKLISGLAESKPRRNLVLLTATPHSGDDEAFHNLLGLLDPKFSELKDVPDAENRIIVRNELALHFIQRRRGDIEEWKGAAKFPSRESRETTYQLTGGWGSFFKEVLDYARTMVQRAKGGTQLEQRMSWWAALALLRCASSSPAAAVLALRTRLRVPEGVSVEAQVSNIDRDMSHAVTDKSDDDSLTLVESIPAGILNNIVDPDALRELIDGADSLRGPRNDPKLFALIKEIKKLIKEGFRPVVFCHYIATARYVGNELGKIFTKADVVIETITGELTPDQREERVDGLADLDEKTVPVLVATDCLSEGINLQKHFNAVIHYDLSWNPTRHEQREGRVDRFGQASTSVRTLMLYGENNPVDGAVLRVILRKAEKIRKELGVSVPLPTDNNKIVDAIMEAVLLQGGSHLLPTQAELDLSDAEAEIDNKWQTARGRITRTVFAQKRLAPSDVLPEWQKIESILGGTDDVERFVRVSCERLRAPLDTHAEYSQLPVAHLPKSLQERLDAIGFTKTAKITFKQVSPQGTIHIHRAHPLVSTLADFISEQALNGTMPDVAARTGAIFTHGVESVTWLYLLRLRNHLKIERRGKGSHYKLHKSILAEECMGIAVQGDDPAKLLHNDDALSLLTLKAGQNMPNDQKIHFIRKALDASVHLDDTIKHAANMKAQQLLADHRRIRDASDSKGLRYEVEPAFPVDRIGVYVFVPITQL